MLYEGLLRLTQKQIKSKDLTMTMEDVEKDAIPVSSNKRESFQGLHISFPWNTEVKNMIYDLLYILF